MSFGLRLKELRTTAKMTQQQLADVVGLSMGALAHIEQGIRSPSWKTVVAISKALNVDCTAFQEPPASSDPTPPGRPPKRRKPRQ